ncbi:hypothetical protein D9M73_184120 [compost metagenome]
MDTMDDAPKIDVEHPLPVIQSEVRYGRHRADACVIAQDVDFAMQVNHCVGQSLYACAAGHVGANAGRADLPSCSL